MDVGRVDRCVEALRDDRERQSGILGADHVARLIDRRGLDAEEAAEVWHRIESEGLLTVATCDPDETPDAVVAEALASGRDADLLQLFIDDIRSAPKVSDTELPDLAHQIRVGTQAEEAVREGRVDADHVATAIAAGRAARDRFVRGNVRLVFFFAREFFSIAVNKLDVLQDGMMGLIKAVDRFEPARGYRFSTYAVWWIRQCIMTGLSVQGSLICLPRKLANAVNRMSRRRRRFTIETGRLPSLGELANELEMDPGKVRFLQQLESSCLSLDAPSKEGADVTVGDTIADVSSPPPDEVVAQNEVIEVVRRNLGSLSERDRGILVRRFGLNGAEEATLQEIADEHGLSRERVRQILDRAMGNFRKQQQWKELQ